MDSKRYSLPTRSSTHFTHLSILLLENSVYFFFAIPFYIFSPIPPHTMCFLFTLFHFSVFATDSPSVQFIPPIIFFQFIFLCTLFNNNNNNATREKIKVKDLCVCDREKSIVSSGICYSLCFTSSSFLYRLMEWLIHRSTCCCWWWWCVVDVVVVVLFRTFILFLSFFLSLSPYTFNQNEDMSGRYRPRRMFQRSLCR